MERKEAQVIDAEFTDVVDNGAHDKPRVGLFHDAADLLEHVADPIALFDEEKADKARIIAKGLRATASDAVEAKAAFSKFAEKTKSIAEKLGLNKVTHNPNRGILNLERK
jgi:hypothetical protein